jgi:hypothetical protein
MMNKRGRLSDFIESERTKAAKAVPPPPLHAEVLAALVTSMENQVRATVTQSGNSWRWLFFSINGELLNAPHNLRGFDIIFEWAEANHDASLEDMGKHYQAIQCALRDAWNAANPDVPGKWSADCTTFVVTYAPASHALPTVAPPASSGGRVVAL